MPKVSEEHKEARREQILAGAQRAFARHGYEGATVARLEEETGLSRGAIFNYFENKEALFIALVRRSSDRFSRSGWSRASARCSRRSRTRTRRGCPSSSRRPAGSGPTSSSASSSTGWTQDTKAARVALARLEAYADDMPIEVVAQFLATLANGVAFARVTGDPMPDLDELMTLIETGVAPR